MFSYNLSDTEFIFFCTRRDCFEVFSGHEGSSERIKIATFKSGRWKFDDFQQQQVFWKLFSLYKNQIYKALKSYNRSLKEKPAMYEFQCVRRQFSIKITKLKRSWRDWFYGLYPTRNF